MAGWSCLRARGWGSRAAARASAAAAVALEALRDCRGQSTCTNDEIGQYATLCGVANVKRLYMEAVERPGP